MRKEFQEAAALTSRYYGIQPKKPASKIHGGLLDGREARWEPVMQEEQDVVYRVKETGVYLKVKDSVKDKDGQRRLIQSETLDDGSVHVSLRVFREALDAGGGEGDPAILAARLAVEQARFNMLVCADAVICPKQGKWANKESVESIAMKSARMAGLRFGLDSDSVAKLLNRELEMKAAIVDAEEGHSNLTPGYAGFPDSQSNMTEWGEFRARLRGIRRQQAVLNSKLEAYHRGAPEDQWRDAPNSGSRHEGTGVGNDCGNFGWEAGDVHVPPLPCGEAMYVPSPVAGAAPVAAMPNTPPIAIAAPGAGPVPVFDVWGTLTDLARRGCQNQWSVPQEEIDAKWERLRGMQSYSNASDTLNLGGCERKLFETLMFNASNSNPLRLTADLFASWATAAKGQLPLPPIDGGHRGTNPSPSDPCAGGGSFNGTRTGCK